MHPRDTITYTTREEWDMAEGRGGCEFLSWYMGSTEGVYGIPLVIVASDSLRIWVMG